MQSQKHFVRKVKEVKFYKMYLFELSQNSGLESKNSQNLTHGTQESQTFPQSICQRSQNLFTKKSKSQSCKYQKS